MTNCLGFELEYAKKVLADEGFLVLLREVRSKKGVDGDECRVIRQTMTDESTVELCYSRIKTAPDAAE